MFTVVANDLLRRIEISAFNLSDVFEIDHRVGVGVGDDEILNGRDGVDRSAGGDEHALGINNNITGGYHRVLLAEIVEHVDQ